MLRVLGYRDRDSSFNERMRPPDQEVQIAQREGVPGRDPASRVRLPIQVGPPSALPKNSFVRIRGLPPAVALSEGHAIAAGMWAVPLAALPTLTLIFPSGLQGDTSVAISLVNLDGDVLAEANMVLAVSPPTRHL